MKTKQPFPGINKHLRRFFLIVKYFFLLSFIAHVTLLFTQQHIEIFFLEMPLLLSGFMVVISSSMTIMADYYYQVYKRLDTEHLNK